MATKRTEDDRAHHAHWSRILLLLPFIAILWVPFYNSVDPMLFGIPFFYWYQLLWILLSAVVTILVYRLEH
jgi:hypothetical protein